MAEKSIRLQLQATATGLQVLDETGKKLSRISMASRTSAKSVSLLTGGFTRLAATLGPLLGVAGLVKLGSSFLEAATTAENLKVRMNTLLGSVEEGGKLFKDLATFAGGVPFEYKEVMASATQLAGIMKHGKDEIMAWMPIIADLAAVSGLSIQDTTSQVQRMLSSGAASADMFRDRGILAMLGFQSGVSYTATETANKLYDEWRKTDSRFRGVTDDLAKTWTGTMSMIKDAWFGFRTDLMEAGAFDVIKTGLNTLLGEINRLKDEGTLQQWAEDAGRGFVKLAGAAIVATGIIKDLLELPGKVEKEVPEGIAKVAVALGMNEEKAKQLQEAMRNFAWMRPQEMWMSFAKNVRFASDETEQLRFKVDKAGHIISEAKEDTWLSQYFDDTVKAKEITDKLIASIYGTGDAQEEVKKKQDKMRKEFLDRGKGRVESEQEKKDLAEYEKLHKSVSREIVKLTENEAEAKLLALNDWLQESLKVYAKLGKDNRELYELFGIQSKKLMEESNKLRQQDIEGTDAWIKARLDKMEEAGATELEMMRERWRLQNKYQADGIKGLETGLERYKEYIGTIQQDMSDFTLKVGQEIEGALSGSLAAMVLDSKNAGDAIKNIWKQVAEAIISELIRVAIVRPLIRGITNWMPLTSSHEGSVVDRMHSGKIVRAHRGFPTRPELASDETLAILQTGEVVLPRNVTKQAPRAFWMSLINMHNGGMVDMTDTKAGSTMQQILSAPQNEYAGRDRVETVRDRGAMSPVQPTAPPMEIVLVNQTSQPNLRIRQGTERWQMGKLQKEIFLEELQEDSRFRRRAQNLLNRRGA